MDISMHLSNDHLSTISSLFQLQQPEDSKEKHPHLCTVGMIGMDLESHNVKYDMPQIYFPVMSSCQVRCQWCRCHGPTISSCSSSSLGWWKASWLRMDSWNLTWTSSERTSFRFPTTFFQPEAPNPGKKPRQLPATPTGTARPGAGGGGGGGLGTGGISSKKTSCCWEVCRQVAQHLVVGLPQSLIFMLHSLKLMTWKIQPSVIWFENWQLTESTLCKTSSGKHMSHAAMWIWPYSFPGTKGSWKGSWTFTGAEAGGGEDIGLLRDSILRVQCRSPNLTHPTHQLMSVLDAGEGWLPLK